MGTTIVALAAFIFVDLRTISNRKAEIMAELQTQEKSLTDTYSVIDFDEPAGFRGPGVVYGDSPPKIKETEYLNAAVGWVYSAVSAIADAVMKLKLRLYKADADGNIEEVLTHPALDLLYRVNKYQTFTDHIWLTQQYLELAGEAPWYVDRGDGKKLGEPQNIILLRPDRLSIKKSEDKSALAYGSGYKYKLDSRTTLDFRMEEVIFLKYPDPINPFRGKGTLQAAAATVDIDNFSEEYNRKFFYNGARPDSIFTTPNKLSANQRATIRGDIAKLYKGLKNSQKVALLEDGLDWKPMAMSGKDMEFMEQQRFSRDKILSLFRVPKTIVAITEDVNLANAKIGEYVFAKWTIQPKLERLIAQLNEFYLPMFSGTENMFLTFENPVPEDIDANIKRFDSALGKGYMTINEVRSELNLEDVGPQGDVLLVPNSVVPVDQAGQQPINPFLSIQAGKAKNWKRGVIARSVNGFYKATRIAKAVKSAKGAIKKIEGKIEKIVRDQVKGIVTSKKRQKQIAKKEWTEEQKDFARTTLAAADGYEKVFTQAARLIFNDQKKRILESMGRAKAVKITDYLLDPEEEARIGVRVFEPILTQTVKEQGQRAAYLVGLGKAAFDLQTKPVQEYLKSRPFDFSFEMNKTTNDLLGEQLGAGVASGESIPQLRVRVEETFDGMEKFRAERIARSEVIRASNFASNEAYKQSGVVDSVEWMSTLDGTTCEWCGPMDGRAIDLGETFFEVGDELVGKDGGLLNLNYEDINFPPLHPNCRCTVVPIRK